MDTFLAFCQNLLGLVPVVALTFPLIALIVDGVKKLGALPDGKAPLLQAVLNLIAYGAVYWLGETKVAEYADVLTKVAPLAFALFASLLATPAAHKLFKLVGLGVSHTKPGG